MLLSVNYSIELAGLLERGQVRVDRIKCAEWPDMIADARRLRHPVYVHFPLDAGSSTGRPPNFAEALAMARDTDTPYVNLHLVTWQRDFPEWAADSDDPELLHRVTQRMIADVRAAADVIGIERIIVENIPYFGASGEFHRASVEPDDIRQVVAETGAGFLLDISHARIAAHYLGVDAADYICKLPVAQLRELHVTGIREHNGRLADHMDLGDEDWRWVEWAMRHIRSGAWSTPWTVAFEYGGVGKPFAWRSDARVLAEQVPRLFEIVRESHSPPPPL
jgi:uncharacterized protein (UPF0276 family)